MTSDINITQRYYCIYRITNLNKKSEHYGWTYIGQHLYSDLKNPLENYYGSGFLLKKDLKQLSKKSFSREILEKDILTMKEADSLEIQYIAKERLQNPNKTYNLAHGGHLSPNLYFDRKTLQKPKTPKKWYTNDIKEMQAITCPEGYHLGRLKSSTQHFAKYNITRENPCKGKNIYNNGIREIRATSCPEGFSKGRLKTSLQGLEKANKIKTTSWNKGIPMTLEKRKHLSEIHKGKKHTEEEKQKLKEIFKNRSQLYKELREKQIYQGSWYNFKKWLDIHSEYLYNNSSDFIS